MRGIGLAEKIRRARERRIKIWPVRSNRASSLGHSCMKHLVLMRTSWEELAPHSVDKQGIFDEGNHQERIALRDLDDAGVDVVEQQVSLVWEEYGITGHIDGMIRDDDGILVPLEIKSMSPYAYEQLAQAPDVFAALMSGKRWYWKNYPTQLLLYCAMKRKVYGVWLFKNKVNGDYQDRIIHLTEHEDFVERILEKATIINCHVANGTVPDGIDDWKVCRECGFVGKCMPDRVSDGQVAMMSDLEYFLDLREQLKDRIRGPQAELKVVESEIRDHLHKQQGMVIAGKWRCTPHTYEVQAKAYKQTRWDYEALAE